MVIVSSFCFYMEIQLLLKRRLNMYMYMYNMEVIISVPATVHDLMLYCTCVCMKALFRSGIY